MNKEQATIRRLQENLFILRKICGWTTQELGDRIGLTKQTISNLENGKSIMSKLQYIGLRTIFQNEVDTSNAPYAELLKNAIDKLLDAKLTREEYKNYQAQFLFKATAPKTRPRPDRKSIAEKRVAERKAQMYESMAAPYKRHAEKYEKKAEQERASITSNTPSVTGAAMGITGTAMGGVTGAVMGAVLGSPIAGIAATVGIAANWLSKLNSKDDDGNDELFKDDDDEI